MMLKLWDVIKLNSCNDILKIIIKGGIPFIYDTYYTIRWAQSKNFYSGCDIRVQVSDMIHRECARFARFHPRELEDARYVPCLWKY